MNVLATRGGPGAATLVREVASRGRPALLAAVAEVWGAGELTLQRDLERRLLAGLANTIEQTHGSATLRLRTAFGRVDRWLVDVAQPELGQLPGSLVAGVSAVLSEGDALVVAQTGPGLIWLPLGDGAWLREPNNSPWLDAGRAGQASTGRAQGWPWPALGQGHPAAINWSNPSPDPGDGLILLSTVGAALSSSGVAALVTAPETEVVRLASAYLPPEAAFVRLVVPNLAQAADEPRAMGLGEPEPSATRWRLPGRIALGLGQARTGDQSREGAQMQAGGTSQTSAGTPPLSGPQMGVAAQVPAAGGWPAHVTRRVPPPVVPADDDVSARSFRLPEGWPKAAAGYLTRLAVAILPVRTDEDEGGYPLLAARFAAALALVFPIVVFVLAWMVWASGGR